VLRDALALLQVPDPQGEADEVLVTGQLPSAGGMPLPSPELRAAGDVVGGEAAGLSAWMMEALGWDAAHAPALLLALADAPAAPEIVVGDGLLYWIVATRYALELVARQRLLPTLQQEGSAYVARWRPLLDEEGDAERMRALAQAMPPVCRALGWENIPPERGPRALLMGYVEAVVDAAAREAVRWRTAEAPASPAPVKKARKGAPAATYRPLAEAWLEALRGDPVLAGSPKELAAFYQEYRTWAETGGGEAGPAEAFRVFFRLDPPEADEVGADGGNGADARAGARDWALRYLVQATDDPSLLVPAGEVWRQRGSTARFLNRTFDHPHERLLAGLGQASRVFPPIEASLHTATPEACALTTTEAYDFVREKALLLRSSGFGVLVPGVETRLGVRVKLGGTTKKPAQTGPATFTWDTLVHYDWQLALGGEPLSREEFETLARLKEPLVQIRGRWVELRPEQLERALAFFQRTTEGEMALPDALKLALAPDGDDGLPVVEVETDGWIDDLLHQLRNGQARPEVVEPPGFRGTLRGYQKVGISWLSTLRRYGLGACLADDMGLGKTIQLIGTVLHEREPGVAHPPTLLICPTSVVGNWRRELERFAPSLRVLVHHGAGRTRDGFADEAAEHDIVISTYALLPRDEEELAGVEWGAVALDEAQNIKNPATKAAQAVRGLRAGWRVVLTGTPVENRLSELWSIFQFLNPDYLGSQAEFRRRFALPIERARDSGATARLKTLVAPFILRRLKTDRTIIQDLPEKNEMKVFCTLTKEQVTLYEAVVQDSLRQIEESEGLQRRGIILATLTKLKQVCDHPALFLHDNSALSGRSGKLARLGEMLDEVVDVGDRALLFTQYAEMGTLLKEYLESRLGREVLFLYGGTPAAERDRMVARFQAEGKGPPVFILSIKAGGTGLNLTRANHVFHFDRWWNPAVENQATDRAFRIGQRRDVQVHKFICAGTFEEAIDGLIERKKELSEAIVGTSEAWITEMSTEQLRDLFALQRDAAQADDEEEA
jgi:SNF2 family DNA or RNA helicase